LDVKDFYFLGDDYRFHFETEAKRRFLEFLKGNFNSGVQYKGKTWQWDTIILCKAQELARFLQEKAESLDFRQPSASLKANYGQHLHSRFLSLSAKEAHELYISKRSRHFCNKV